MFFLNSDRVIDGNLSLQNVSAASLTCTEGARRGLDVCDIGQSEGGAEVAQMRSELQDLKAEVARLTALVAAGRGIED